MKIHLTAYQYPDGSIRIFDKEWNEYEPENGLGFVQPITDFKARTPLVAPGMPEVDLSRDNLYTSAIDPSKPGFFAQGGGANKVLDFASGIFRKKDGDNTFVGDFVTELARSGAQPVGTGFAQVNNPYFTGPQYNPDMSLQNRDFQQPRQAGLPSWAVPVMVGIAVLGVGSMVMNNRTEKA